MHELCTLPLLPPGGPVKDDLRPRRRMGVLLMRQQSIHLLLSVAVLVLWWHTEAALLSLQQPPTIAAGTAEFLRYRMPALPFLVLNQNFAGFLQCQRVVKPQMWVGVVMCPTAIFLFWLAIRQLQLGTNGAALALTCVHC